MMMMRNNNNNNSSSSSNRGRASSSNNGETEGEEVEGGGGGGGPEYRLGSHMYNNNNSILGTQMNDHEQQQQQHSSYYRLLVSKPLHLIRCLWSVSLFSLILFALVLFISAGSVWCINYFVLKSGVSDVARNGRRLLLLQVSDHVTQLVEEGPRKLQMMEREFNAHSKYGNMREPITESRDGRSRQAQIMIMMSHLRYSLLAGVWFSTPYDYTTVLLSRYGTGLFHESLANRTFVYKEANGNGILISRELDGNILALGNYTTPPETGYYPTQRPFYQIAQNGTGVKWTSVYVSKTLTAVVTVSASIPVFGVSNPKERVGVLTASFTLEGLSRFLNIQSNLGEKDSVVFIVQPDSELSLVGASIRPIINESGNSILSALKHPDLVIRETAQMMKELNYTAIPEDETVQFEITTSDGNRRIVGMKNSTDPFGLNWITVVISKESTILSSVNESNKIAAIISASVISGVILLEFILICIILQPFRMIYKDITRISNMEFRQVDTNIRSFKLYELDFMVHALIKLKQGLLNFEKFVPSDIVKLLVRQNEIARIGVSAKELTVMFCDVDQSDVLREIRDPRDLVDLLQHVYTELSNVVSSQGGVVDKYTTSGIMALFNAPPDVSEHVDKAVLAATMIQERIAALNGEWTSKNYSSLKVRIGINTAVCLVGNVGSNTRVNYTALGDGVNVASRLEGLNNRYKTEIIIGPDTYEQAKVKFACRWLSRVCLKGKSEPLNVYEVICSKDVATNQQKLLCELHERTRQSIEANDMNRAKQVLITLLQMDNQNIPAIELLNRIMQSGNNEFVNCLYVPTK